MVNNVIIDVKTKAMKSSDGGALDDSSSSIPKKSKKPRYSRFTQQELPACKPILTPGLVIASFTVVGIIFAPIGLASLFASQKVVEVVHRYDDECVPVTFRGHKVEYIQSSNTSKSCIREITVPKHMKSPVYIYYELDNYYQNHRRYVKSRNDKQLKSSANENSTDECDPEDRIGNATVGYRTIVPCGLIAWSMFNDTYNFSKSDRAIMVNKKNIAWASDKKHKFGSDVYPKNFQNGSVIGGAMLDPNVPLSEQEDLIVWMRTAALPTFRKLYGRIEEDLHADDVIQVLIQNNYNSYSYDGKKSMVLSTTSWIGGKNDFLGVAYLFVGGLSLLIAIGFVLVYLFKPRPLGDPSYLSWNINPEGLRR